MLLIIAAAEHAMLTAQSGMAQWVWRSKSAIALASLDQGHSPESPFSLGAINAIFVVTHSPSFPTQSLLNPSVSDSTSTADLLSRIVTGG